ncbi:unnamed protein product [Calypogeia fissa]
MALKRAYQWDQPATAFGLAPAEPARPRTQTLGLDPEPPLPFGWEKCFDLQTGVIFFRNTSNGIRTSMDPRVYVKVEQHYQQPKKDVDSEAWRGLSRSLNTATLDPAGDKVMDWMDRSQKFRGLEASTIDEKVSKWSQNYGSKKLPPLLSLKSSDSIPSLDLSLRLEGPHARDSSSLLQLSTPGDKPGSVKDNVGHVKLEQVDEQCHQNFLGPNHKMGPFPSNLKVKEELTSASLCWGDQSPVVCNLSSATFPVSSSSRREATETSSTSALEQPEFRDLLGPRYAMGPFSSSGGHAVMEQPMPSSMDQLAGTCTLDKVLMALERTQTGHETAIKNSVSTQTDTKVALPSSPMLLQPPSTKLSSAAASLSPTTSDASSAVSSKSSRHSSTTPSVMSFQGEELDDLGGHGSSAEDKPQSDPKVEEAPITLVAVGCMSCHMFVMLSKDNPSCPRCGKTCLLDISPPRKRQRKPSSPLDTESHRH